MTKHRGATGAGSSATRSRVSNGSKLLPGVDGRSAVAPTARRVLPVRHCGGLHDHGWNHYRPAAAGLDLFCWATDRPPNVPHRD